MPVFRIEYVVDRSVGRDISLIGEIERPTLIEALKEFYDECGSWVKYKKAGDFDITQQMPGMSFLPVAICPGCDALGDACDLCGGTGQATANEGLKAARP